MSKHKYVPQMHDMTDRRIRLSGSLILFTITSFIIVAIHWAAHAPLDEVTRGFGRVIPSSQVQQVQNLEGGLVKEICVKEGDEVSEGTLLLRLDPTIFSSMYKERRAEYLDLLTSSVCIKAELDKTAPSFPDEVKNEAPTLVEQKRREFSARQKAHQNTILTMEQRAEQLRYGVKELSTRIKFLKKSLGFLAEEVAIIKPNVESGISPKLDLLRIQQEICRVQGKLDETKVSLPKSKAVLKGAQLNIQKERDEYEYRLVEDLNKKLKRLAELKEVLPALKSRLARTEVKSPVAGIIKKVSVNTVGEVIAPGMKLVEIVPKEDKLVIEAKLLPSDIAFVEVGQKAMVKLTAYDFSIFGGVKGVIERIGADSFVQENGQSYYTMRVTTEKNYVGKKENPLPILPGMVAQVDVLSGKKTVLDYIMKPILKARQNALRER